MSVSLIKKLKILNVGKTFFKQWVEIKKKQLSVQNKKAIHGF